MSQPAPEKKRRRRGRLFRLELAASREELIAALDLLPADVRLATTKQVLSQIIDQMPPARDARVNVTVWQLAMVAQALVERRGARAEAAVLATIQTFAPSKQNDTRFRENVHRVYRKLRGTNPARALLLPVSEASIELAARHLPKPKPDE